MLSIDGREICILFNDPQCSGKGSHTTAPVPTHCTFLPIGVEVFHSEIMARPGSKEHQSIGSNTEMSVAETLDLLLRQVDSSVAVIDQDEVVPGAMVFGKYKFHYCKSND